MKKKLADEIGKAYIRLLQKEKKEKSAKMTREEAISILEMLRFPEPWEQKLSKGAEEALDMAIACLSAQNEAMTEEELAEFKKELANAVPKRETTDRIEYGTDGQPYKYSISTDIPKEKRESGYETEGPERGKE